MNRKEPKTLYDKSLYLFIELIVAALILAGVIGSFKLLLWVIFV